MTAVAATEKRILNDFDGSFGKELVVEEVGRLIERKQLRERKYLNCPERVEVTEVEQVTAGKW